MEPAKHRSIRLVLGFERTRLFSSRVWQVGSIFLALILLWVLQSLVDAAEMLRELAQHLKRGGGADELETLGAALPGALYDELGWLTALVTDHSYLLGPLFLLAVLLTPWFALLLSADQTALDMGRRHIRFLLPRMTRVDLFFGRVLGAWLGWCVVMGGGLTVAIVLLSLAEVSPDPVDNALFGVRLVVSVCIYGLPFVALMALCNALVSKPFHALLIAYGGWIGLVVAVVILSWVGVGDWPGYLNPTSVKYLIVSDKPLEVMTALAALCVHTGFYLFVGASVFRRRDA